MPYEQINQTVYVPRQYFLYYTSTLTCRNTTIKILIEFMPKVLSYIFSIRNLRENSFAFYNTPSSTIHVKYFVDLTGHNEQYHNVIQMQNDLVASVFSKNIIFQIKNKYVVVKHNMKYCSGTF